jgi:hypothetical protein
MAKRPDRRKVLMAHGRAFRVSPAWMQRHHWRGKIPLDEATRTENVIKSQLVGVFRGAKIEGYIEAAQQALAARYLCNTAIDRLNETHRKKLASNGILTEEDVVRSLGDSYEHFWKESRGVDDMTIHHAFEWLKKFGYLEEVDLKKGQKD